MKKTFPDKLEAGRIRTGRFRTSPADGGNGAFFVFGPCGTELKVIASDGLDPLSEGWEHVSVSTKKRTPNWTEMSFVKSLFWDDDEEGVVQFHPPRSAYVNNHPHCLHIFRNAIEPTARPPSIMVGVVDPANPTPEEAQAVQMFID